MVLKESKSELDLRQNCNKYAPNGGWGWVVTFSGFMACVILDGISYSFGLFYKELLEYFNESKSLTSWIISVFNGTYLAIAARKTLRLLFHSVELAAVFALKTFTVSIGERQMTHVAMAFFPLYWPNWRSSMPTGPLTSILVATFGLREVTTIGAILAATALFLCTFSANVSQMILCFGLFAGFGFGLLYLPALVTVGQYFTTKRALATGITLSGSGVGAFVFAPLAKFLIDKYGWRGAMWIFSGIALNRVPLGLLLRPLPSSEKPLMQQVFRRMSTVIMGPDGLPKAPIRHRQCSIKKVFNFELFKSVTFICFGSTCFLCMFGFFIPFLYIPDMVIEMGMTSTQAAALISIVGAFSTCGRIGAGWIVDKHWTDCILFTSCTLMISGAATIFVPYYSIFWIMAAYSAVFGLSIAVFVSLRSIILAELLGIEKLSSALGLVTLCQGSATLIGAPVAGALADISGSYDISLVMSGSAFICAGLLCLPLRKIRNWEYMPTDESGTELSKLAFSLSKGMRKVAFGMDFAYWGDEYEREREMHLRRMSIKSRKSSTKSRKSKKSTSSRMSTKSRSSKKSKTSITEVSVIPVPEICQDDFRKDSRL